MTAYWGDTIYIWRKSASEIVRSQAMEEYAQKSASADPFPLWDLPRGASAEATVEDQAMEEHTQKSSTANPLSL